MKKKTEKAYFNEQWEKMVVHLNTFLAGEDQEELHLFRVQVKKLGAMLILFDAVLHKSKLLKEFKPVREIFKRCGIIRNAYINLQLGIRYHLSNEHFSTSQQFIIENGAREFKALGRIYLKTIKSVHREIEDNLRPIDDNAIYEFYKTKLAQVANTLTDFQFNDELHDARKQIKTLLYNRKIAFKALDGKLQVNNDYLDKLQDNIGTWHDNALAIELFSTPELNDKQVISKINRQNAKLKRSITLLAVNFAEKATLDLTK